MVNISGTVVDNQGDSVEGVVVTIVNQTSGSVETQVTTDSSGDYSAAGLPNDTYHVLFDHESGGTMYNAESKPYIN